METAKIMHVKLMNGDTVVQSTVAFQLTPLAYIGSSKNISSLALLVEMHKHFKQAGRKSTHLRP